MDIDGLSLVPKSTVCFRCHFIHVIHDELVQRQHGGIGGIDGEIIWTGVDLGIRCAILLSVSIKIPNQLWIDLLVFTKFTAQYGDWPEL